MKKIFSLLIVTLVGSASAFASGNYDCSGTEPFWDMQIRGPTISYADPMKKIPAMKVTEVRTAAGMAPAFLEYIKAKTPAGYLVTATVNANETCSDGMSEDKYSHQVVVHLGGAILFGCCNEVTKR